MKKKTRRIVSILLALSMVLSHANLSFAQGQGTEKPAEEAPQEAQQEGVKELDMEDLDPSTLGIKKLGEEESASAESSDSSELTPATSLEDIVRVSIFLDGKSTADAGFELQGIAENGSARAYRDALKASQQQMTARIEAAIGHTLDVKWNLTLLTNAISANVKLGEIPLIERLDGVAAVEREMYYEAPVTEGDADPQTANTSSGMVGAAEAWAAGYTGAGSRIAIIDTGIDKSHQSFNEAAFNYSIGKLANAPALMTAAQVQALASQLNSKSGNYVSAKIPYGYNYVDENTTITHLNDTQGEHGSHVAGIASANRYIKSGSSYVDAAEAVKAVGMAPDAQLLIMKVFGSAGGAYDSDYFAAIEDAVVLGADSVNLSLGSGAPGFSYAESAYQSILNSLVNNETNSHMVVSISAGNAGAFDDETESGLYAEDVSFHTGGSPGSFVNSLGVASADNIGETGTPLKFNGSNIFYTETSSSGAAMSSIAGTYSFVYIDAAGNTADYQAVNSALSLSGKIVIVNRGDISFYEKGNNAKSYNPKALIVANNTSGTISMALDDYTGTFPVVSITLADANAIKAASTKKTTGSYTYYTGSITVTNAVESGITAKREDAVVSDFSSWGVPGSLLMKPEITAPGGNIYSVFGTNKTSSGTTGGSDKYELMSGTSMAAPHITGLAAVVAQYLRENDLSDTSAALYNTALTGSYNLRAITNSLLMSTATPMMNDGNYLSILQQGAGLANVYDAVQAKSVIMMDEAGLTTSTNAAADGKVKAELGDDPGRAGSYDYSFTIYNLTDEALTYELDTVLFTQAIDGENLSHGTVLLPAGGVSYEWNGTAAADNSHDVNQDGVTDEADVQAILKYVTGELEYDDDDHFNYVLSVGDMDGDEVLTSYDAYLLLNQEPEAAAAGYTVAAHDKAQVTVRIRLTAEQKAVLEARECGAYLEGFTSARCTKVTGEGESLEHEHTIPILGYYGSWTDPTMFDTNSYTESLYGNEQKNYSGNDSTNYLRVTYNGVTTMFSGNPYMTEEEFPADRLALSTSSTIVNFAYNLIRSAGTVGYAATKLDEDEQVTKVLASAVNGNNVTGQYYSASNAAWQNTTMKTYSVNKAVSTYDLSEGDRFRVGFYAIPEYNAMIVNDSYNEAASGELGQAGFNTLLLSNVLGKGAFIGYDFTVDNTEPVISQAVLSGSNITVSATDNQNLAYVAVLSLDGTVKYAEAAPGSSTYSLSADASQAISNAKGYVAVFAADYAGNETAKAVKVNNNTSGNDPYTVTGITLTPSTLDLYKGNTADLVVKVSPITAEDRTVSWKSSNPSVATVDANGHVTAVAAGSATITATSNNNKNVTATCSVKVTSVNKALNGIIWDEAGDVYFSGINTNSLPAWTKLHSDPKGIELMNAFMANASTLYASTNDLKASVIYTVNRNSYALTEFGTNYVPAFGMARASTRYTDYFVYGFANYLVFGNLTPEEDEELGTYSGFTYGLLDLSTTNVGDAYVCGVAARSIGTTSSSFYFLDETGKIWQTTLRISSSSVSFGTPTLVVDTGIGTSFLYQSLYYDGTYIYWSHCDGEVAELIIINPSTKAVYHAGNFGEGVWPVAGLYVNGSAAPAAVGDEAMDAEIPAEVDLSALKIQATRDELLTADFQARFAEEAAKFAAKEVKTAAAEEPQEAVVSEAVTEEPAEEVIPAEESTADEVTEAEESADESSEEATGDSTESDEVGEETSEEATEASETPVEEEPVEPSDLEETEAEEPSEEAPADPAWTGSLNAARVSRSARNASDSADLNAASGDTDEDTIRVTLSEAEAVHNGLYSISFDPEKLTYSGTETALADYSVYVDDKGVVSFAYATKDGQEVAADDAIAVLSFTAQSSENLSIEVITLERNAELDLDEGTDVLPSFKTHSLVLSGQIGVNFFMDLSMLSEEEKAESYIEFLVSSNTEAMIDYYDAAFMNQSDIYYGFTCYVNSLQMADTIQAVYHYQKDGIDRSIAQTYSALEYINAFEEKASEFDQETQELVKAIADYGYYAQHYLAEYHNLTLGERYTEMTKHYTESYDYDTIKNAVSGYALKYDIEGTGVTKVTHRLSLESETVLDIFFTVEDGVELEATASFNGKTYSAALQDDGRYMIHISGISAHQLGGDAYRVNVSGNAAGEFTASAWALSYVNGILNSSMSDSIKDTVSAFYQYYVKTMAYRAKHQ